MSEPEPVLPEDRRTSADQAPEPRTAVLDAASVPDGAAPPPPGWRRARSAFRHWRHTRPFWGGLFVVLGGSEILYTYSAPFRIIVHFGLYGLAGFLLPSLLTLVGVLILFDPTHRTFYSILAVLSAAGTWLTSNLGGFVIGMFLGIIGGSLAFGWTDVPQFSAGPEPFPGQESSSRIDAGIDAGEVEWTGGPGQGAV